MLYVSSVLLVVLLVVVIIRDVHYRRTCRLPPGPTGLPLLGNLLQLPAQFLHFKLHTWSKQYGPFYTFWVGSQPYAVISSVEVGADVLDRMSAVTSHRPKMIKPREFFFRGTITFWIDRGLLLRGHRRSMHASLNVQSTARFNHMQTDDAAVLTLGLLQHPEKKFHEHIHRFAGSVVLRSIYGGEAIPIVGPDSSKRIEQLTDEAMHATMPQHSVVDTFPVLKPLIERVKWLRKEADDWFEAMKGEAEQLYNAALPVDAWDAPTIVHDVNTNMEKYGVSKREAVFMAVSLFMAGQETSHTSLRVFALAMLHHPDVVRAAQAQLDTVCGERAPTFRDRDRLPYVEALVKETLRWRPAVPLSLPHTASEDFEYRGRVVRKGTVLLDNLWSQTRDPSVYSDPESFDPTRFLDESGRLRPVTPGSHLDQLGFGHGRRICPGKDFAINSLFIACAHMLWAFDFQWPVDEHGKTLMCGVDDMMDNALVITPKPFEVVLKPRFEGLEERLRESMKR
ncbi:cytochrome P450 [Calocera viscosa TUFC12733]|uniref:Cytochrome P450 n=1 Tax=Calocera viscosa (strain TUFC12733) TaxID=1330018 RepID=A0A167QHA2_CALVF|nr:cytochrome P450 [Calocera viscosa TUFC12733]